MNNNPPYVPCTGCMAQKRCTEARQCFLDRSISDQKIARRAQQEQDLYWQQRNVEEFIKKGH